MSSGGPGRGKAGPEDKTPAFVKISQYLAIGLEFPSTILGGLALGYLLDRYFNTSPWYTVGLTLLALFGGLARLVVVLRRLSSEKK